MAYEMSDSQMTTLSVAFVDKKGNPAKVDGSPQWMVDNTDLLAVEPATDGMSCAVKAVGPLGTGLVTMKADADMGSGVVDLIGTFEVTITAGQATVVTITATPPVDQP